MKHEDILEYKKIDQEIKELTAKKEEIRERLIEQAKSEIPDTTVPIKIVTLPSDFFDWNDQVVFFETRFPGWEVDQMREEANGNLSFYLKLKKEYVNYAFESDGVVFRKSPIFSTPDIDWEGLEKEAPGVTQKISQVSKKIEVDSDKLEKLLGEDPNFFNILERHLITKKPGVRIHINDAKH